MTQRIAIVGASVRAAAVSAVRAGFQVAAADQFADADLCRFATATKVAHYPHGLLDWLEQLRPRPAAWIYTGALENHPDLVDAMAAVAPLWGNGGSVLRQVRSPLRLAEVLRHAGLRFPETRDSAAGLPRDGSWLAKTGRGASGSGVSVFTDESPEAESLVYQRRVAGTPYSAVYVAASGGVTLLGVVRQLVGEPWLGAREFQYCGAIGPCPLSQAIYAEIVVIGQVVARAFGLVGLFGVDLVIDGKRVWVIEVNPRYTASVEILERATGIHPMVIHVMACRDGKTPDFSGQVTQITHGKAILFASRSVTISTEFANWALAETLHTPWPTLADIPTAGTTIDRGRPILTIFAESSSTKKTSQELQNRVAEIERRLYSD